ncbi:MAG: hypothetical protein AB7I30_21740 [Isosphaeraceae bacterium]
MNTHRNPDAVRAPLRYAGEGDALARLSKLQEEFSKILGVPRVFVRHQGQEHFLSGRPDDTLGHDQWHPRPGSPRYTWEDRGDGVLYGRRINDEAPR